MVSRKVGFSVLDPKKRIWNTGLNTSGPKFSHETLKFIVSKRMAKLLREKEGKRERYFKCFEPVELGVVHEQHACGIM